MKKLLLLIFITGITFQSFSYEKLSLVERFTNASCGPCATINNSWYNTTTANLLGSGSIAHIIYNGWWPGSSDPMYLLNQSDNTARINYYGVNAVPWIVVNGSTITTSQGSLTTAVTNGNAQYSPFQISIAQNALSNNLIELVVTITRDPSDTTTFGNVKLRFGLTERTIAYASPPGSNGESHFFSVCRKMLPDASGTQLTIPDPGESTEVILQYVPTTQFINSVNFDSLRAVAWIQTDDNRYTYQSYMMNLIPNFVAQIQQTSPDVIADNNTIAEFSTTIYNLGFQDDTYSVNPVLNAPEGWTGQYTTVNGTFNFGDVDLVEVAVGESAEVLISVNPNGINGFGETSVNFTSQNEAGVNGSTVLRNVTTTGVDLLVIDASGEGYGNLIDISISSFYTRPHGIVTREALQNPGADLNNFYMIAWVSGNMIPVFTNDDVTKLTEYLDQDGRLFITGQNIGEDIFDVNGQSQFAQSFYNNYLHANYVADFGGSFIINGIDDDPISGGITFFINDLYARSPDEISPFDNDASPIFKFGNTTKYAGLKVQNENHRVVYLSVGLEQITSASIRDSIIFRSVSWLMEDIALDAPANETYAIDTYSLNQNYPNPFNPTTTIAYSIAENVQVRLKVYDLMGAEVAELVNEKQNPGFYEIKFDASKLASGIYFFKLNAGNYISTKKMTLLK